MILKKLTTLVAAVVCAFAVSSARAQVTNAVTFSFLQYIQKNPTTNSGNTTVTYSITKAPHSSAQLVQDELIPILTNITHTAVLTSAAKLVLITGNNGASFAVIDGTNFFDLSTNGFSIMTLSFPGENKIKSGTESLTPPQRNTTQMQLINVSYDDGSLSFSLQGLVTITQTDTAVVSGTYTETDKAKATLQGEGTQDSAPFVLTATMSLSGSGKLVPVP